MPKDLNLNLACVVRTVGERTAKACRARLEVATDGARVHLVGNKPFPATLADSLEAGLKSGKKWLLCVDADVLPFPGAIAAMLARAERSPESVAELQGLVFDRFFGGWRPAGVHLYRVKHLPVALTVLQEVSSALRPETSMLDCMAERGLQWKQITLGFGLHDFDQHPRDISRKSFIHAWKHTNLSSALLGYWRSRSAETDFVHALRGFAAGVSHLGDVPLSKEASCYSHFGEEIAAAEPIKAEDPVCVVETEYALITSLGYRSAPVWDWAESFWGKPEQSNILEWAIKILDNSGIDQFRLPPAYLPLFAPLTRLAEPLGMRVVGQGFTTDVPEAPTVALDEEGTLIVQGPSGEVCSWQYGEIGRPVGAKNSRIISVLEGLAREKKTEVVVYGAGEIGRSFCQQASAEGVRILAFMESLPQAGQLDPLGRVVLTPEEALRQFPQTDVVIASRAFVNPMLHRLLAASLPPAQKVWVVG